MLLGNCVYNLHSTIQEEAISEMFEKGLNVPDFVSISGHKTASQLFRYVQVNARL